jgi:peptidoglycan/LPS O-acetylase OafA/YrhL
VGQISYGLYLYHWIVYEHLDTLVKFRWGLTDSWWYATLKIALSFAVAIASWHLIEQPILRLKDRFSYQRGKRNEAVPEASPPGMMAVEAN